MNQTLSTKADAAQAVTKSHARTFVTFKVAGVDFAMPTLMVREVYAPLPEVFAVPHAPRQVLGVVNLRSQLFLILNSAELLVPHASGARNGDVASSSRLLLLKPTVADSCGLLVDSVGDIVTLSEADLRPAGDDALALTPWLVGVGQLRECLLALIDPARLIEHVTRIIQQQPQVHQPGQSPKSQDSP